MNLKKMQIRRVLLFYHSEYNVDWEAVIDEVTEAFSVELRKIGSFVEVIAPTGNKATIIPEHEIRGQGICQYKTPL